MKAKFIIGISWFCSTITIRHLCGITVSAKQTMHNFGRSWNECFKSRNLNYHTSNSCNCMGVNGKALQLHAVYIKSCKNPYQVLQVTCSGSDCAMKSKVNMIKSLSP